MTAEGEEGQGASEPKGESQPEEMPPAEIGEPIPRRRFLKYAILGGAAAAAAGTGAYVWLNATPPGPAKYIINPWTVDYDLVPQRIENSILRVAQWYDYWPGSFILDFQDYIREKYGVNVEVVQDVYTSNEQLFTWMTSGGRKFDVIFPTQYMVEQMERAHLLFNMNPDWLPNYSHLFAWTKYTYPGNEGYVRQDPDSPTKLLAVPYQWGTTGIGFRTDQGWTREDIETDGMDIFWMDSYKGVDIRDKLMMLDDIRETIGMTHKYLGWHKQEDLIQSGDPAWVGVSPTNIARNQTAPYSIDQDGDGFADYQWSHNETSLEKIAASRDALIQTRPRLLTFNTQDQGPFLVNSVVYIDTAWSGDIMYAIRPHTSTPQPVDYWVPSQGSGRWIDNAAIHKESRNLWLAHEFIDFFLRPDQGASITDWNLYATPNESAFDLLTAYPQYNWDPREDPRIYADDATGYSGPSILQRCEYQHDLGSEVTKAYIDAWNLIKFR